MAEFVVGFTKLPGKLPRTARSFVEGGQEVTSDGAAGYWDGILIFKCTISLHHLGKYHQGSSLKPFPLQDL